MSKHTPGPWYVDTEHPMQIMKHMEHLVGTTEYTDYTVADISEGGFTGEEELANARLIAAAPEMYEAMRRFRNAFVGWIEARDSWDDEEIADAEDFLDDTRKGLIDLFERIEGETK